MLIAGTHSGVGKTTVATGLMAALHRTGVNVGAAKVGPDYIDPGYHRLATGRPSRNLDGFLAPQSLIASLAARAGRGCDLLVIEGVMGLFDGAHSAPGEPADEGAAGLPLASTAAVAVLTRSPVVLVVDASAMSQSVAALVHGFASWSDKVSLSGLVLNRVGSDAHEEALRRALDRLPIPILGVLRRDDAYSWRDRHLGLVPVAERPLEIAASLDRLATAVTAGLDLAAFERLAASAPPMFTSPLPVATPLSRPSRAPRIAVAAGPAFSFVYPDNLEALTDAGAELVSFDPVNDPALPEDTDGLYAGGGFPEVYAEPLSENVPLLREVAEAVASGMTTWAECGGLLWLSSSLDEHRLCGAIAARASMTTSLTLGYRTAIVREDNPVATAGSALRGHEFHYSALVPAGKALRLSSRRATRDEGYSSRSLFCTYLHLHLGTDVLPAQRFVATASRRVAPK